MDLKKIIKDSKIPKKEIARQLFPNHKHPDPALQRIVNQEGFLDEKQIIKLAYMLEMEPADLLREEWKVTAGNKQHTFTSGEYVVKLNTDTGLTRIYHNESLEVQDVITFQAVTMTDYFKYINSLIQKIKKR